MEESIFYHFVSEHIQRTKVSKDIKFFICFAKTFGYKKVSCGWMSHDLVGFPSTAVADSCYPHMHRLIHAECLIKYYLTVFVTLKCYPKTSNLCHSKFVPKLRQLKSETPKTCFYST